MNTYRSVRVRQWMVGMIGFALIAGVLSVTATAAEDRYDRHRAVAPYRTPHMVFDHRYRHDHYYPVAGYSVRALPPGYLTVGFSGRRFFFHGGVWFQPAGPGFVVVRPPVGIVVPTLPPAYATVRIGGAPYYYANDVYYQAGPGGYAVVAPPDDAEYTEAPPAGPPTAPPAAPAPQASAGMWYYCESARVYYPYVSECREGWRQVPATPQPSPR